MSQSVTQRLEALRIDLARIDPFEPGCRERIEQLQRQIAMLTEDQRQKPPLPKQARRFA